MTGKGGFIRAFSGKRSGIRRKVVAGVVVLIVVSFLLLCVSLSAIIFRSEKEHLLALQHEIAGYAGNEMLWDVHELDALLSVSAENYDLSRRNGTGADAYLARVFGSRHMAHHNILDELSLIDEKGKERARLSRTAIFFESDLRDFSNSGEFLVPKRTGEIYYGPVHFEEGNPYPRMTVSLPVFDSRNYSFRGVLTGGIRLNRIWENAVERSVGEAGIIFITAEDGKVLAHPEPSIIKSNTYFRAGSPEGIQPGLNGEKVMLVSRIVNVGDRKFIVYASLPLREVLALSLQTLSATAAFLVIFLFCSVAVSLFAVNRLLSPLEELAGSAREISAGKPGPTVRLERDDEIGELSGAFSSMTNKLVETIHSLEQRNELLNNILNSLTHPFYVIDARDYTIKLANPAARFGSLSGTETCYALTHHSSGPCGDREHPCVIAKVKEARGPVRVEHIHYDSEGRPLVMEIHGYPIFGPEGNIVQVIEYNLDITTRKKVEEKLLLSEQRSRAITATANDAIILMDPDGLVSIWNPASESIFGYSEEEVLGKCLHDLIMPERYREAYTRGMEEFRRSGRGSAVGKSIEMTARRKDGTEFPIELSLSALLMKGRWHAVGIVRDITRRKLAEDRVLESLREKELLLHEIHHRVKNNMQVITSLLDLQLGYLENRDPEELFSEIKNRIRSMSLVHEKLYLAKDLSQVDFGDYISTLVSNLYKFYNADPEKISLSLDIRDISLGIDTAIPCGLIVNELITNALKYAFPAGRTGEIQVRLLKTGETAEGRSEYELAVRDDGIGMPESLDLKEIRSLGLYLVTTLAEHQLQGTVSLNRTGGTGFLIRFRESKHKKRV